MTVGDLYTVEIPSVDGHEPAGTRPAIIVQAFSFEKQLPTTLIVPLSSQLAAQNFPWYFFNSARCRERIDDAVCGISIPATCN